MNNSIAILFYLRKSKKNKQGEAPIYLRITTDGKRSDFSTRRFIDPVQWDANTGRGKGSAEVVKTLNNYLLSLENKAYKEYNILISKGDSISSDLLRNKILGIREPFKLLLEVFQYEIDQIKEKVGGEYAPATYDRYRVAKKKLHSFIKHEYKKDDMQLEDLNHQFVTTYEFYLKTHRKNSHNTVMKDIKILKRIIKICISNQWIQRNPFVNFRCTYKDPKRGYLTQEELDSIENKQFSIHRLDVVRDIFIFSCYTGLSYADIALLTPSDIQNGIDRERWIIVDRLKTGTRSPIPLLPKALAVIEKYKDYPVNNNNETLLPIFSNQRFNSYLKEIADVCGINKHLHFHLARHTFATTVTLSNGVPIETVSKMLGHLSIRTTQIYSKVEDTKISQDMKVLKEKIAAVKEVKPMSKPAN